MVAISTTNKRICLTMVGIFLVEAFSSAINVHRFSFFFFLVTSTVFYCSSVSLNNTTPLFVPISVNSQETFDTLFQSYRHFLFFFFPSQRTYFKKFELWSVVNRLEAVQVCTRFSLCLNRQSLEKKK